jgi:hypothetical protein
MLFAKNLKATYTSERNYDASGKEIFQVFLRFYYFDRNYMVNVYSHSLRKAKIAAAAEALKILQGATMIET